MLPVRLGQHAFAYVIAVFGAFAALLARHMVNNVYAQIGLVMLIGLSAKNAILIVEFAKDAHEGGQPLTEAALAAARQWVFTPGIDGGRPVACWTAGASRSAVAS